MVVEEYLGKGKKLNATFMILDKAYDKIDREPLECPQNIWCGRAVTGTKYSIF